MKKNILIKAALALVLSTSAIYGQENFTRKLFGQSKEYQKIKGEEIIRCASAEYDSYLKSKNPSRNDAKFESWIAEKIKETKKDASNKRQTNVVITIPVVVHVLHNGLAVGTGSNISDLRVQSQITVLNQDYRRMLNTNGYNNDANGADVEVEFCLVQQTPQGQATNGINRVNIATLGITGQYYNESVVENTIKPNTIWDPTKYMNIWVGDFFSAPRNTTDLRGVLGYAQFPVRSGLNGLFNDDSPLTDGVIIDYLCFGSSQIAPNSGNYAYGYNLGRTTTHEVGHYLGLRHVNGDDEENCTVDAIDSYNDYCLDTPAQLELHDDCSQQYDTCPSSPGLDNYTNFMDYPQDACLNKFTNDQKARIRAVLLNSPRRKTLATSGACTARPANVTKDGGVTSTLSTSECSQYFTANVTLKNTGSTAITSATLELSINGTVVRNHDYTGNLAANSTINIPINNIAFVSHVENEVKIRLVSVNGSPDDNSFNNVSYVYVNPTANTTKNSVALVFYSDGRLQEMSYLVTNDAGVTVASGTLPQTQTYYSSVVYLNNLVNNMCYTVKLTDSGNDGLRGLPVELYQTPYNDSDLLTTVYPMSRELTFKFTKNFTLGAEDFNSVSTFGVYPNPANSILNISVASETLPKAYTIFNTLGQVVKSKDISNSLDLSINIDGLASGIYMIKVDAEKGSQTLKFIKK